jgi:hypothetical protein
MAWMGCTKDSKDMKVLRMLKGKISKDTSDWEIIAKILGEGRSQVARRLLDLQTGGGRRTCYHL